jgi:repressor LexA
MIDEAVAALEQHLAHPSEQSRSRLWTLFRELTEEQNEHRRIYGGPVRIIKDKDLLLVEYAVRTVVADGDSVPLWAYQTARRYAERYDPGHWTGLTPASVPFLRDIVDFWLKEFGLDAKSIAAPTKKKGREPMAPQKSETGTRGKQKTPAFTHRQGQFLAFIHHYRKLHRQGPAELDMVQFFRVTPPSVHGMVVKLTELGLVTREPGVARSVRVAIPEDEIPPLEAVQAPPW